MSNRINILITLLGVFVFVSSCGKRTGYASVDMTAVDTICVDLKHHEELDRESMIDWFEIVRLETKDNNIIGNVSKLFVLDSVLIVVDQYQANNIYVFNRDGNYLNKISGVGNGPHEYLVLTDVAVYDNNVYIKDNMKRRIMVFDVDGTFIETKKLNFQSEDMACFDEGMFSFSVNYKYYNERETFGGASLLVTDKKLKPIYHFGEASRDDEFSYSPTNTFFKSGEGELLYYQLCNPFIYSIAKDSVKAKYYFEVSDNEFFTARFKDDEQFRKMTNNNAGFWGKFWEIKDFSCFQFIIPEGRREISSPLMIYDHTTKQTYYLSNQATTTASFFFNEILTGCPDNVVACAYNASFVAHYANVIKEQNGIDDVINFLNGLSADSNPVIFFYKLKSPSK